MIIIFTQAVTQAATTISETTLDPLTTTTTEPNVAEAIAGEAHEAVSIFTKLTDMLAAKAPALIFALIILIIGLIFTKITLKIFNKVIGKANIEKTTHSFLKSFVRIVLLTIVFIMFLTLLGVPMTSIVAVVGAAGLALSLALQQSLSNVAGGLLIIFSKPFKAGDFIETHNVSGTVESISILYTKISTIDNKISYVPNGIVANETITNYTGMERRRLDIEFSVDYNDDFRVAKRIIEEVIADSRLALQNPAPVVRMSSHAESAIILLAKVWVNTDDYWDLKYDLLEQVKLEFDRNNISIPFNHLDVHIEKEADEQIRKDL
ncbi:MAG: mechanosensitive ion channel family protein [Oscillospiraceae bacterium]|nr:mechanosensitive ion channel family protein [Oscillospiraceae bacterium]